MINLIKAGYTQIKKLGKYYHPYSNELAEERNISQLLAINTKNKPYRRNSENVLSFLFWVNLSMKVTTTKITTTMLFSILTIVTIESVMTTIPSYTAFAETMVNVPVDSATLVVKRQMNVIFPTK